MALPATTRHTPPALGLTSSTAQLHSPVLTLQSVTLLWVLAEFGASFYAAASARSPAVLAFGADSLVELLSAALVLLQSPLRLRLSERSVARIAAVLLFLLAAVVLSIASASLLLRLEPRPTRAGIAITAAALAVMPALAWAKRREAHRAGNTALAADAVQSAACAYLALITLLGLTANALLGIHWLDPAAALVATPILIHEARRAWKGSLCTCH